jgi:hypothetical protein
MRGCREPLVMTSDPDVRPPFWKHRYYYLTLKIVVLLCGVYFALRILRLL